MAVLTASDLTGLAPVGRYFMKTLSFTVSNTGAADEWIVTGLRQIKAVVGFAVQGATKGSCNFVMNNLAGTGTAADQSGGGGGLGVESDVAATIHVTVLGR